MPTPEELKSRIESTLPGAVAQVVDTTGTQDHFYAHIVAPQFAGLSLIDQHKLVYQAVGFGSDASIHALSMKTAATS
jgi:stress-induced morphogen